MQCDGAGDQDPDPGQCRGTNQNDGITGTAQRDIIFALGGFDEVSAGGGQDELNGGDSADTLDGGTDNDTYNGGAGNDWLTEGDYFSATPFGQRRDERWWGLRLHRWQRGQRHHEGPGR